MIYTCDHCRFTFSAGLDRWIAARTAANLPCVKRRKRKKTSIRSTALRQRRRIPEAGCLDVGGG